MSSQTKITTLFLKYSIKYQGQQTVLDKKIRTLETR